MTLPEIIEYDLLKTLNFENLPPEEGQELLTRIHEVIFQGVILEILRRLSEHSFRKFEELMSGDPAEERVTTFLKENVPDLDEIVLDEIARFKKDGAAVAAALS